MITSKIYLKVTDFQFHQGLSNFTSSVYAGGRSAFQFHQGLSIYSALLMFVLLRSFNSIKDYLLFHYTPVRDTVINLSIPSRIIRRTWRWSRGNRVRRLSIPSRIIRTPSISPQREYISKTFNSIKDYQSLDQAISLLSALSFNSIKDYLILSSL